MKATAITRLTPVTLNLTGREAAALHEFMSTHKGVDHNSIEWTLWAVLDDIIADNEFQSERKPTFGGE